MSDETKKRSWAWIARVLFGAVALLGMAAIAVELCVVVWVLWDDISRGIAATDWVLLVLVVPLSITILVFNRSRAARRCVGQ
jgi:hypothetical protein